jgi:hypothetical protein
MTDPTPHTVSQPTHIAEPFREVLNGITEYLAREEFNDFCECCVREQWTLEQARHHIAFSGMLVEWYLAPDNEPNPERYALKQIKICANEEDYAQFDPSLKINV